MSQRTRKCVTALAPGGTTSTVNRRRKSSFASRQSPLTIATLVRFKVLRHLENHPLTRLGAVPRCCAYDPLAAAKDEPKKASMSERSLSTLLKGSCRRTGWPLRWWETSCHGITKQLRTCLIKKPIPAGPSMSHQNMRDPVATFRGRPV